MTLSDCTFCLDPDCPQLFGPVPRAGCPLAELRSGCRCLWIGVLCSANERRLLITQGITLCLTVVAASCSFWAVALWITPFFSALWAITCFLWACPKESNGMYSRGQAFLDSAATVTDAWFCLSVADVAAIACGREFLVNSSRVLLDTILQLLGDLKPGQCTKLKVYGG